MPQDDFSGIPALNDEQGLSQFLQQQELAAAGFGAAPSANAQPQGQPTAQQPTAQPQVQQPTSQQAPQTQAEQPRTYTQEELAGILAQVDAIRQRQAMAQARAPQPQSQPQPQSRAPAYSPQEIQFINQALAQGYSMTAIQNAIDSRRAQGGYNPQVANLEQRMNQLQQYLATQEYREAEAAFVNRLTEFGDKFGLSEQDLVTFGQTAMQKGINIAVGNVDLEAVFRAVYPEQYAIRSQRIAQANSSQIYGGSSAAEPTGVQSQKAAAEYARQFLLSRMPNYPRNNK